MFDFTKLNPVLKGKTIGNTSNLKYENSVGITFPDGTYIDAYQKYYHMSANFCFECDIYNEVTKTIKIISDKKLNFEHISPSGHTLHWYEIDKTTTIK